MIAETAQIDAALSTKGNELADGASNGGALLKPGSGEAVRQKQIGHLRMTSNKGILVKGVVRVVPGPSTIELDSLEHADAVCK